jgi:DNA polymerase III delta prime subunit
MSKEEELVAEISDELNRLESLGLLQSKSTNKYDSLRTALGDLLGVNSRSIYISTIDKAANANARMQQMQIRTDVPWRVFVGVCTKDDVLTSKTYLTQTQRNLTMPSAPELEGSLWISKNVKNSWQVTRAIFKRGSGIPLIAQAAWPTLSPEFLDVKQQVVLDSGGPIETPQVDDPSLSHIPLDKILSALSSGLGQVILAGPPGTGKSYAARLIASHLMGEPGNVSNPDIAFVQFHPNYEYEDFVEGFRPMLSEEGHFQLSQAPGLLLSIVNEMAETPDQLKVLIIDEINRANLSKVLGEALFLMEYRETEIALKTGTQFAIPKNLMIIATMNTADRNIRTIDIALRRRFRYFELGPSVVALRNYFESGPGQNLIGEALYTGFLELNAELESLLDRHHTIGHTFFMLSKLDLAALSDVWEYQVSPLIEEYFFDQSDLALDFTFERFFGKT